MKAMKRLIAVGLGVIALQAASATTVSAAIHITPHEAALITIQASPGFCRATLTGVRGAGYEASFLAFEAGYGEHTKPSAAKVFHDIVNICKRRLG
jgi:hypothetical protein